MKNRRHLSLLAVATAVLLAAAAVGAALLGVTPGVPTTTFTNPGSTAYNASTQIFSVSSTPASEAFGLPTGTKPIYPTRALTIRIQVDNTGVLVGGVAGDDLTLTGTIYGTSYSGVLLTGEILAFGSQNVSTTDAYDFRFRVTGGALAPLYGNNDIGVRLTSENSTFTGSFAGNFGGLAKGTIGPIAPLVSGRIGDFVWQDLNRNGVQDAGEPGIDGVTIRLKDNVGTIQTTTTGVGPGGQHGYYQFTGLAAGSYMVVVEAGTVPAGFTPTTPLAGGNPAIDSDGLYDAPVTLPTNSANDQTIDFGYVSPCTGQIGDFVWNDANHNGIQDAGESGIPNVTVWLKDAATGAVLSTAVTDAGGIYTFAGVCPGTYVVEVNPATVPAGMLPSPPQEGGNPAADSDGSPVIVTVGEGEHNTTIDFGFYPPAVGAVGDIVWQDLNRDGIQDAGEPGINGVTVQLFDSSMNLLTTQITHLGPLGQNGYYQFTGLTAGTYFVQVLASSVPAGFEASPTLVGGDRTIDSNTQPTQVVLPTDTSIDETIDFGYNTPARGIIGDFVWNDLNRNGVQDAGEPGIDGVIVYLRDAVTNVLLQTTTTANGGYYEFDGLAAGSYTVVVDTSTLPSGFVASPLYQGDAAFDSNENGFVVTLPTDTSIDRTIDFGYNSPCSGIIGDRVWNDANRNGIQDAGEEGLVGITVELVNPATNTVLHTATTGVDGIYMFNGVCAGTYEVRVVEGTLPPGFVPTVTGAGTPDTDSNGSPATVTLPTDSSIDVTIDFGYEQPCTGTIGDFVWDDLNMNGVQDAGEPGINGVTLHLYDASHTRVATQITHDGGQYLFTGVCAGAYTVEVEPATLPDGYVPTVRDQGTPATDSNFLPASVTLATDFTNDTTIDFGYFQFVEVPAIAITKLTNGTDGSTFLVGTPIVWTYDVTNVGNVPLSNVTVTDNRGVAVTCPKNTLAIGESMQCTGTGTAVAGVYTNTGNTTGTSPKGQPTSASDDSSYIGVAGPGISITKTADPTSAAPFQPITYTYVVTNTGGVTLTNVTVKDDNATPGNPSDDFIVGTVSSLAPGASATLTLTITPSAMTPPVSNVLLGGLYNYSLFALNGGTMSINSATSITGNVGISAGVDTLSAQKVDAFTGTAYVHTGTAATDFYATYAPVTFAPSGGIISNPTGDARLDLANTDADNLETFLNGLSWSTAPTLNGAISQTLTTAGTYNLYNVSWAYDTKTLTLNGGPTDWFIFRSTTTGNTWADSQVVLNGVDPNHVLFYFTGAGALDFTVNKSTTVFQGTIFAPDGEVIYHNPATFNGRIVAKNVTVHSDFNITQPIAPAPVTLTNTATATGTYGVTTVTATDDATVTIGSTVLPPPPGTIGNFVWSDLDADGVQDAGEPGIAGVTVVLKNAGGTTLATTTTDASGLYQFTNLTAGTYIVQVPTPPAGFFPSPSLQGADTAADSNGSPTTVTLPTNSSSDMTIDFGYVAQVPGITIVKLTNGLDGGTFVIGTALTWTYDVKNTGNVVLTNVAVTDNRGVAVTCPNTSLNPGASMQCTANGTAVSGTYTNIGTVTGTPPTGGPVTASDGSSYVGVLPPGISITKTADPLTAYPGQTVTYSYTVTNTGGVTLNNISVTDDNSTPAITSDDFLVGTIPSLAPGASTTLTKAIVPLRDTISEVLGGIGPSSGFAVLSLGGDASHTNAGIKCSNATVAGNIGVVSYGDFNNMAACSYAAGATFYKGTNVTYSGWSGPIVTNETYMNQLRQDAFNASTYFAGLTPTQTISGGTITSNMTLTGVAGMNVVNISTLDLAGGETLTLLGPPGTQWVFNVSTKFYLDASSIVLGPNLTNADVIWNLPNTGETFGTHGNNTFRGIVLAPYTGGTVFDLGPADGMFIGGYNQLVTLMSGTHVTAPTAPPPTVTNIVKATVTVNGSTLTATASATVTLNK